MLKHFLLHWVNHRPKMMYNQLNVNFLIFQIHLIRIIQQATVIIIIESRLLKQNTNKEFNSLKC